MLFILVGFGITGRIERKHNIIKADSTIVVNNEQLKTVDLVKKYQPVIYSSENIPEVVDMKYEVSEIDDAFVFIYHTEWEDESHPNFLQDVAWRIFRFSYFGFTLNDSEYIQINIDKKSGNLVKVKFDSPDICKSSIWAHDKRITTELEYQSEGVYQVYKIKDDEKKKTGEYGLQGNILQLEVKNWNHLFEIAENPAQENRLNFDLTYLEDDEYKSRKYARRHFGDIHTPKSAANTPIIIFASIIFITYFVIILRDYSLTEKKINKQSENA